MTTNALKILPVDLARLDVTDLFPDLYEGVTEPRERASYVILVSFQPVQLLLVLRLCGL